ncbi:MAG TPA: nucleotidyltransferase domain-containing protein [Anaerolineae bacterium]|mgnify:CR=1 FL=1|nr:nucleotidyltransferase domain-containing protein [Anaerolineae bacterium]HQI85147.1 nucleotidyltransferase domain-containing protein [Anaerolineae bacterium]
MAETRALQNVQQIETLVSIIAQTADPEQVILFGSQASGAAHADSDYDFMVVMRDVENERLISRRIYHALLERHIGVAVDIIVVDAEKLTKRRYTPGLIYRRALQEGKVCYDRTTWRLFPGQR